MRAAGTGASEHTLGRALSNIKPQPARAAGSRLETHHRSGRRGLVQQGGELPQERLSTARPEDDERVAASADEAEPLQLVTRPRAATCSGSAAGTRAAWRIHHAAATEAVRTSASVERLGRRGRGGSASLAAAASPETRRPSSATAAKRDSMQQRARGRVFHRGALQRASQSVVSTERRLSLRVRVANSPTRNISPGRISQHRARPSRPRGGKGRTAKK